MKVFGKFVSSYERVKVAGYEQPVSVIFLRNERGEDLVDVVKASPHPFYIAITDNNTIISMSNDIEQSQVSDHTIIGIDKDFGFTFGPGGTVYGMVWNGKAIVTPESILTEEQRRENMKPLARADFRLRMKKAGINTDTINQAVASIEDEDLREDYEIIWEDGQSFNRLDPFVLHIFKFAEKTAKQADKIWED